MFMKLFIGQNYGLLGFNSDLMDTIYVVVLFLAVILVINSYLKLKKSFKRVKELEGKVENLFKEIENVTSERDILVGEYKLALDKYDAAKKKKDVLHKLAYNDSLTDLPNKIALQEVIDSAFATLRKDENISPWGY